jgi:hypothetical protein
VEERPPNSTSCCLPAGASDVRVWKERSVGTVPNTLGCICVEEEEEETET